MPTHRPIHRSHTLTRQTVTISRPQLTAHPSSARHNALPAMPPAPLKPVAAPIAAPSDTSFQPDPYVDYGRFLTPEGGVLLIYKDLDLRWRHTIWRLFAWACATGFEAWWIYEPSMLSKASMQVVLLVVAAILNWLIVAKPVELYRRIEIRSDGLILENAEVFWLRFMDAGLPEFRPDSEGNLVLSGIYGTRLVEFLTVRHFDEFDKMPEAFMVHLQDAMKQLWSQGQP